jgi:hypothetical protein
MPLENFDEVALLATQNDRARRDCWFRALAASDEPEPEPEWTW